MNMSMKARFFLLSSLVLLVVFLVYGNPFVALASAVFFTTGMIMDGKQRKEESIFNKYHPHNPNTKLPRKVRVFIGILFFVAAILGIIFRTIEIMQN